jgi:hypothetical protein
MLDPAVRRGYRALLPCKSLLLRLTEHRGPVHPDGCTGTVLVAGRGSARDPVSARFFSAPPERRVIGTVPLWRLPATLSRLGATADVVVAALDAWSARTVLGATYVHVPQAVTQRLVVPDPPVSLDAFGRRVRRWLRKVLAGDVAMEVSRTTASAGAFDQFDEFYHLVYLPFARRRYGDAAIIHSFYQLRRAFRHGGTIVWAARAGRRLAGCFVLPQDDVLRALLLGTAGGDLDLEQAGMLYALYFFVIRYASQECYREVDLGQSVPLLSSGVLHHKALWGARLVDDAAPRPCYSVWWNRVDGPAGALLGRHPLIFRHRGAFAAVTSLERDAAPSDAALSDLARAVVVPGLRQLFVILRDEHAARRRLAADGAASPERCEVVAMTNRDFWRIVADDRVPDAERQTAGYEAEARRRHARTSRGA